MEEVHNHPENRAANDPSRNMEDSLTLPTPECTFAHEGPQESRGSGGRSATVTEATPIDLLPNELLLVIFELYTGQDTPARNLVALSLVCKLWRGLVEGTASLWCCLSGRDGLPCLRKAVAMAKDVPLEIKYLEQVAKTDTETFFAEVGGRIAQWKSLDVGATKWDPVLATLKQANTPKLKTLNLRAPWSQGWRGDVVTLFGGEPASVALKDLHVESIPLAIAPLRLSRLRSLELQGEPIISTEEILRVLSRSPRLKQCDLLHLTCLRNAGLALPSHILDYPTIQLSHLRSLNLRGLPISLTHFILSVIRAPKLRKVSVDCTMDQLDQSPASDLFTAKISHLIPSFKDLVKTAERIEMLSYNGRNWTFSIGRLMIGLGGRRPQLRHLQETLDWVFRNLGGHLRALPGSLKVHEFEVGRHWFIWLASNLNVTKLDLQAGLIATLQDNREIVSVLSRPLESANNQWLLPNLESIKINAGNEDGRSKILEMVHARHSYIDEQGEGRTEGTVLKPFQEIWLRSGKIPVRKVLGPDLDFLTAVQKVGRGVKIWWEDVEWTGTECASCVGEVEGSA